MGTSNSRRLQQQIISRRRTQHYSKRNETAEHRTTSGSISNYPSSEETFAWEEVGYGDERSVVETD